MWPLTPISKELITILIYPDQLICASIARSCNTHRAPSTTPLILRAYKKFALNNFEITPTTIANPRAISTHIKQFLKTHNMLDANITISLSQAQSTQQIVTLPLANPRRQQFATGTNRHALWDYQYLYPAQDNQHTFYTCSINQSLLLQYKLVAIQANINLITITTQHAALLQLYRYIYGAAFRPSQLALDMTKYNNTIENLFNKETVKRIITYDNQAIFESQNSDPHDNLSILTLCGLYICENIL